MKLKSLKYTKKDQKKKDSGFGEVLGVNQKPEYPYGTELHFDEVVLVKIPEAKSFKVGEKVQVQAVAEVVSKSSAERKGKKSMSMTFQLTEIGIEKKSSFSDGFNDHDEDDKGGEDD